MKPNKCPKCGSKKIAEVLYGLPAMNEKLDKSIVLLDTIARLGNQLLNPPKSTKMK